MLKTAIHPFLIIFCCVILVTHPDIALTQSYLSFIPETGNDIRIIDLCKFNLSNPQKDSILATIDLSITNDSGVLISQLHTQAFKIPPKKTFLKKFTQNEISFVYNLYNKMDFMSPLPPGNYIICAILFLSDSAKTNYTECEEIAIQSKNELVTVAPKDKFITKSTYIEFKWNKPQINNCSLPTYSFKIVQVDTNQTAQEAFLFNPVIYYSDMVISNVLYINRYSQKLKTPARYAWQVSAVCDGIIMTSSSPKEFIYDSSGLLSNMLDSTDYLNIKDKLSSMISVQKIKVRSPVFGIFKKLNLKNTFSFGNDLNPHKFKTEKPIKIYGSGKMESYFSTGPDSIYQMAANYAIFNFQPNIAIYGLPFVFDIYYTTDRKRSGYNSFSISFDYNTYLSNLQRKYETKKDYINSLSNGLDHINLDNPLNYSSSNLNSLTSLNEYMKRKDLFSSYDNIDLQRFEDYKKLNVLKEIKSLEDNNLPGLNDITDSLTKTKYGKNFEQTSDLYELSNYLNNDHLSKSEYRKLEDSLKLNDPEKYKLWKDLKKYSKFADLKSISADSANNLLGKNSPLSKFEKVAFGIRELNIGKSYPSFSELTVQGISFTGLNLACFYKPVYVAILYGKANDQYSYFLNNIANIDRKVTGIKVGLGDKDSSHFHISVFQSNDNYLLQSNDTNIFHPKLHQNYLLSAELRLKFKERFNIISEYARSILYSFYDTAYKIEYPSTNWLSQIFVSRNKQYANSAFYIKGNFNITETNTYITGYIRKVSPDYNTLFVPFIKKDNLLFDFRIDQKLFKNKITLSVFLKNNHDNLDNWKPITTTYTYYGLKLSFKYKQKLTGSVSYSPIVQKNDAENPLQVINNKITNYSGNLTWYKNLKKTKSIASFGYSAQQFKSLNSINDYFTLVIMANEVLNFKKSFSLNFHFDYIIPNTKNDSSENYSILLSASYNLGKKVLISAGAFTRLSQEITSLTSSVILTYRINKYFDFSLRVEEQYLINEIIKSKTNNWMGSFGILMQL